MKRFFFAFIVPLFFIVPAQAKPMLFLCEGGGNTLFITLEGKEAYILFDHNGRFLNSGLLSETEESKGKVSFATLNDKANLGVAIIDDKLVLFLAYKDEPIVTMDCK